MDSAGNSLSNKGPLQNSTAGRPPGRRRLRAVVFCSTEAAPNVHYTFGKLAKLRWFRLFTLHH